MKLPTAKVLKGMFTLHAHHDDQSLSQFCCALSARQAMPAIVTTKQHPHIGDAALMNQDGKIGEILKKMR